jgi:hypothetical protein
MYSYFYVYVFFLTCTLTEVFTRFFLSCKANARIYLEKTGHGPNCVVLCIVCACCVVLCIVCV